MSRRGTHQNMKPNLLLRSTGLFAATLMFCRKIAKGAFVSESALHNFDGDKPNFVDPADAGRMIIHLIRISPNARRIFIHRGATIPEDF